jgi:hypothetical protein
MSDTRPTVFIGSSKEGLPIAEAVQLNLDYACEATIWSQGVFGLGEGTLEALLDRKDTFDFAVLVLTPDDLIYSRDESHPSARDNVLFELGIFLGALGRRRTFVVYDRTSHLKMPSDLAGVTHASYQPHASGNLQAALGAATTLIKGAIQQNGKRREKLTAEVNQNTQFQIIHDLLDNAPEQFIILMGEQQKGIGREPYFGFGIQYEYYMRDRSAGKGGFSVDSLCKKLPDAGLLQQDLRGRVTLTQRGREFATWLTENGHKAVFFQSDIGGWGERPADWPAGQWPAAPQFRGQIQPTGNVTPQKGGGTGFTAKEPPGVVGPPPSANG